MIWIIVPITWVLITCSAFVIAVRPFFRRLATLETITNDLKRSKWFWIFSGSLAVAQAAYAFAVPALSVVGHQSTLRHTIVTLSPPPPFSCLLVKREEDGWYVAGPATIDGIVFQDQDITPHAFILNGVDVYDFISGHCEKSGQPTSSNPG